MSAKVGPAADPASLLKDALFIMAAELATMREAVSSRSLGIEESETLTKYARVLLLAARAAGDDDNDGLTPEEILERVANLAGPEMTQRVLARVNRK